MYVFVTLHFKRLLFVLFSVEFLFARYDKYKFMMESGNYFFP